VDMETADPETPEIAPPARPEAVRIAKVLAFAVVPALFVGVVAFGFFKSADPGRRVGEKIPPFELPLLGKDERFSEENLRGSPTVINFWASWCLPCRDEAPTLEQKWRKYRDAGAVVLGVNVQDAEEDASAFVEQFGLTFPIVRDVQLELWRKLGVRGIPETFFLDHNSVFTGIGSLEQIGARGGIKVLGAVEPAVLESQLKRLVERKNRED
jgi:cytochrome c biogenesis protein CcmG/thiol:disulfide interchange protein DsbE